MQLQVNTSDYNIRPKNLPEGEKKKENEYVTHHQSDLYQSRALEICKMYYLLKPLSNMARAGNLRSREDNRVKGTKKIKVIGKSISNLYNAATSVHMKTSAPDAKLNNSFNAGSAHQTCGEAHVQCVIGEDYEDYTNITTYDCPYDS
ncbi:hypothetical protein FQA39_LY15128 [Lamprigera yunnana]|nr:hypothetical protein FQA39_LY15128 [Lamprigera yunnana]